MENISFDNQSLGATGPPWSGAGVGVGILRGTIMFLGNLKDSKIWSTENTKIPRRSKLIQKQSILVQKSV